ncbi:inactive TPR repeat-containing thioredoxin TTL3-like [Glycine soja]|uniref:Inactive TPR repeat-containing thioredoxin TTL3 n=1 Tax=Glycine soja TaxID=3848 RepID=A0A445HHS0_GLYSO|nr:inactive TPR repeat-containing thioredoxin TTL3-like [Glycine soja]KHN44335.1 Inactive TPR repeat-containing thioredoxin TTL3 [Glycine soja]RZB73147.1 Inactive TPR repeat-containing thioredoxin TTL3 [Glycine soja]
MGGNSPERKPGCGLMTAVFRRNNPWSRKSVSAGSSPMAHNFEKPSNTQDSKRRHGGSNDFVPIKESSHNNNNNDVTNYSSRSVPNPQRPTTPHVVSQRKPQQNRDETTMGKGSSPSPTQGYINQGKRVPKEAVGISGELESMINEHLKSKGSSTLGNLGNLRQGGVGPKHHNAYSEMDYYASNVASGGHTNQITGREYDKTSFYGKEAKPSKEQSGSLCRAVSTRMDPEQLKIMGNEDYKNGRFAEALALYDAAIAIDPNKASYRSNRSAALTALGRLLEAVFECREAIRIESHYQRAHHRLGNLNLRLGETDKALYHYKQAGPDADPDEIAKAKTLQVYLNKCTEARRFGDWITLITATNNAISSGADSAPQIYALQAEALLKLHRHQDADKVMSRCPKFDVDQCTRFFGPIGNANLLVTRAQVDLVAGRFEEALEAAQKATRLDSNSREANKVMRKARALTSARAKGNELFKASNFHEACIAYGEGLDHDPYNSVLLCNRAACRSKLGQFEKAIDDCNTALNLRPSYIKARLRRADCNAKLERWEASIQDYEILLKETPEDEEVKRALMEAQAQLEKQAR